MAQKIKWTEKENISVSIHWKAGWTAAEIGKLIGRSRSSVGSKVTVLRLRLDSKGEIVRREQRPSPIARRLEVNSIPEPNSGCLLWLGAVCSKGYGSLRLKRRTYSTHRLAYEISKGQIPEGMFVLHHCDMPSCINPDHLFLGTNQENMDDMDAKNRRASQVGTKNGNVKLTE